MSLHFTFVDLLTVVIVLVSIGFAVWRGFIAETLSILAWAAGAFAALYFGPYAVPMFARMISPSWLAALTAYGVIFLVVLIPISFATFRLSQSVRQSSVGPLDHALGAAFGIARGLVVVGGLYLLFSLIVPLRNHPAAVRDARLLPLIQSSAEVLIALAPSQDRLAAREQMQSEPEQSVAADPPKTQQKRPEPSAHRHARKVYGAHDRRALDRLIGATGDSGKP